MTESPCFPQSTSSHCTSEELHGSVLVHPVRCPRVATGWILGLTWKARRSSASKRSFGIVRKPESACNWNSTMQWTFEITIESYHVLGAVIFDDLIVEWCASFAIHIASDFSCSSAWIFKISIFVNFQTYKINGFCQWLKGHWKDDEVNLTGKEREFL